MKFCVIGPVHPFRGGIAQHTTLLCRHLADKHDVEAVSFKRLYPAFLFPGKTQMDQSKEAVSFDAVPLIDSIDPLTWTKAGRYIKEKAPDVVVVEWWHPFFAPCLASVLRNAGSKRVIFVCHNVLPHEPKPFIRPLTMHALRNGDGFLVHAKQEEEILRSILPNARVARTPLPSLDVFPRKGLSRQEAKKSLDIQGPTILFFGLIRKYKGLIDLVRAVGLMKDRELTCIIAGEFYENKQEYISEIERLGIADKIRIVDDYIPNESVERYFAAADIVVLPYRSATQSGVVQVAYNFERPVIVTKVGGLPEAVEQGKTGFLVPPEDPEALAQAIKRYFDDSLESVLQPGVRDARKLFSWEPTVEALESLGASH